MGNAECGGFAERSVQGVDRGVHVEAADEIILAAPRLGKIWSSCSPAALMEKLAHLVAFSDEAVTSHLALYFSRAGSQ